MDSMKLGYEFLKNKVEEKEKTFVLDKASLTEVAEFLGYKKALYDIAQAYQKEIERELAWLRSRKKEWGTREEKK